MWSKGRIHPQIHVMIQSVNHVVMSIGPYSSSSFNLKLYLHLRMLIRVDAPENLMQAGDIGLIDGDRERGPIQLGFEWLVHVIACDRPTWIGPS